MHQLRPTYLLLILLFTASYSFAQSDTLNQVDENGMKQGYWIVYGRDMPEKGYPADGIIEEGYYVDDRKQGTWIKYHEDGVTPRLKGEYVNGRPNGDYIKYHVTGQPREIGNYTNRKQVGKFEIYSEEGVLLQEKTFNDEGREDGKVAYYYPDGTPEFVMEKKDGKVVGTATRYWPNGDVKQVITYNEDGSVKSKEDKPMVNSPKEETQVAGAGGPRGDKGVIKDGTSFQKNGYNKIYNDNDELWMDGEFKNGRLWNGKLYKYDSDGILLKIEIWKEGKYHSDGQLG